MQYEYEATTEEGNKQKGMRDADTAEAVAAWLKGKGLSPLSIVETRAGASKGLSLTIGAAITVADKIFLLKHLSTMLHAGLRLAEAIDILISETTRPFMKRFLTEAKDNIERGLPFSVTFKAYPKYFSPVFVGVLEAGEASGTMEKSTDQLLTQITKEYELNHKVKSAMAYPAILLSASILIISLLVTLVLPRLGKMFDSMNVDMPIMTRILMQVSDIVRAKPLVTVAVIAALIAAIGYVSGSRRGRDAVAVISLRTPILKKVVQRIVLARMLRILGTLMESGLSIVDAVKLTAVSVGHASYRVALEKSIGDIERGIGLSASLEQYPKLFPRIVTSMMGIGEQTGSLTELLKNLSTFYDEETDQALKNLLSALEPLLLAFMGLLVGGVAISILLPIYKIVGAAG